MSWPILCLQTSVLHLILGRDKILTMTLFMISPVFQLFNLPTAVKFVGFNFQLGLFMRYCFRRYYILFVLMPFCSLPEFENAKRCYKA